MQTQNLINSYIQLVIKSPEIDDEVITRSLMASAYSEVDACNAVRFIPLAVGRQFLRDLGIEFCEQYWVFSSEGEILEQNALKN